MPQQPGAGSLGSTEDAYYSGAGSRSLHRSLSDRQIMREQLTPDALGLVVCLVGLPARGKSFISRKVERFLRWTGSNTRMFNVGKYRRDAVDATRSGRSEFFDSHNSAAMAARDRVALQALADALDFLDTGGKFAILDATNSTQSRRKLITDTVGAHSRPYSVIFVEAVCDDAEVLEVNMRTKVQFSPDFAHLTEEQALADLKMRIAKYEDVYETVQDSEGPFIKLYNLSSKVMANHCYGRVAKSILPYLMAIHVGSRPIWLVRAGSGQADEGTLNGNRAPDRTSRLSQEGREFALSLAAWTFRRADGYWEDCGKKKEPTMVLTSTMPRAVATVSYSTLRNEQRAALNPIDKGVLGTGWWDVECPSDTPPWGEVERRHPEFMAQWRENPLRCHFPGGESYMDVIMRLESVLVDVEMCTRPVLIVSHVTTLQLLKAYFMGMPVEEAWQMQVKKNTVFEVIPTPGGGFQCEEHDLETCKKQESQEGPEGRSEVFVCLDKRCREGSMGAEEELEAKRPKVA
mmetsp:Transcript_42456/g.76285  ORF Transcript_42456/g.76285 Transcript_42456/m.76285 type:complete len:518 (+) Transcript_42456:48-1601(+)|eukprot:CAMPEP_0197627192 /NCGR_PEP_ID=MMETSP1338-20131121/5870_1 /TAXON_ID=43686 ORGANISM="Pelagodinium beii, Strain RCC1491" /NCGR_SAMPLE_ID=MMETSP1338 /ASSEMBLY_ACC=CAM_ASM_000754 /LENGTH=517 /DNA_ID=CAMNT_0043197841 /DNA_START=41 /DNA_END=1594 /DNA_ORIENTATION=-